MTEVKECKRDRGCRILSCIHNHMQLNKQHAAAMPELNKQHAAAPHFAMASSASVIRETSCEFATARAEGPDHCGNDIQQRGIQLCLHRQLHLGHSHPHGLMAMETMTMMWRCSPLSISDAPACHKDISSRLRSRGGVVIVNSQPSSSSAATAVLLSDNTIDHAVQNGRAVEKESRHGELVTVNTTRLWYWCGKTA